MRPLVPFRRLSFRTMAVISFLRRDR